MRHSAPAAPRRTAAAVARVHMCCRGQHQGRGTDIRVDAAPRVAALLATLLLGGAASGSLSASHAHASDDRPTGGAAHSTTIETRYRSGLAFLNRGLYADAAKELEGFLAATVAGPESATARYSLALCLVHLGRHAEASEQLDLLEKALAATPSTPFEFARDARWLRVKCAAALGEHARVADLLDDHELETEAEAAQSRGTKESVAWLDDPRAESAEAQRIESNIRCGRIDRARELATRFVSRWPASPARNRAELWLASVELRDARWVDVCRRIEGVETRWSAESATAPPDPRRDADQAALTTWAASMEAQARHALGDHAKAIAAAERCLARNPSTEVALAVRSIRAEGLFERKQWAAAADAFDELLPALTAADQIAATRLKRAAALSRHGDRVAAAEALTLAHASMAKNPALLAAWRNLAIELGDAAVDAGDDERGQAAYASVLDDPSATLEAPLRRDLLLRRASALHRLARREEAVALYAVLLSDNADSPEMSIIRHAAFARAQALLELGRNADAAEALEVFLNLPAAERDDAALRHAGVAREQALHLALLAGSASGMLRHSRALLDGHALDPVAPLPTDLLLQAAIHLVDGRASAGRAVDTAQVDQLLNALRTALGDGTNSRADTSATRLLISALLVTTAAARHDHHTVLERFESFASKGGTTAETRNAVANASPGQLPTDLVRWHLAHAVHAAGHANAALGRVDEASRCWQSLVAPHKPDTPDEPAELRAGAALELAREASAKGDDEAVLRFLDVCERCKASRLPRDLTESADTSAPERTSWPAELDERLLYLRGLAAVRLARNTAAAQATAPQILRLDQAIADLGEFRERFAASPLYADATLLRTEALLARGRPAEAADDLASLVAALQREIAAPRGGANASRSDRAELLTAALLRLGDAASRASRHAESERAYEGYLNLLAARPQHNGSPRAASPHDDLWASARFGQAFAREQDGRLDGAVELYRDIVANHHGFTAARAQFQIGECLFALGRLEDALREFIRLDALFAAPGEGDAGVLDAGASAARFPLDGAALFEAARCLRLLGRRGEARTQFEEVVRRFPNGPWAARSRDAAAELAPDPLPGQSLAAPPRTPR